MEVPVRRRLPDEAVERARRYLAGHLTPSVPKDAATVVLLRPRPGAGVELYLLHRVPSMPFAGGMYAFPGGGVDPRDADRQVAWAGPRPEEWGASLAAGPGLTRSLVCAAVRETFEESGVLLAGPDASAVTDDTRDEHWESERSALVHRSLALADLLDRRGLLLRADLLRPWAHWITPEFEPRRYDTRFFVAALPEGQWTRDVGGESDLSVWMRPAEALDAHRRGEFHMMPPTVATLADLADFDSVEAVLAHRRAIEPVLPSVTVEGDHAFLLLPNQVGAS